MVKDVIKTGLEKCASNPASPQFGVVAILLPAVKGQDVSAFSRPLDCFTGYGPEESILFVAIWGRVRGRVRKSIPQTSCFIVCFQPFEGFESRLALFLFVAGTLILQGIPAFFDFFFMLLLG